MTSFWSRLFPQRSLSAIQGPAWARFDGEVISPNAHESPFSGMKFAAGRWWLMFERTAHGNRGGGHSLHYTTIGSGWIGGTMLVKSAEGPTVLVPLAQAALVNAVDAEDVSPVQQIPPSLRPLIARLPDDHGTLCFRELMLRTGDRVELRAVMERTGDTAGYRETAGAQAAQFRACPEHGKVHIFDYALG